MAKKQNINMNFENLKQQMIKKKEMAEGQENRDVDINKNTNVDDDVYTNDCSGVNKNDDTNICDDVSVNNCVDINTNKNVNIYTDKDTNKNVNNSININVNKIVIMKKGKEEEPKRVTYYLKPQTIKKIDKYSKSLDMGKSEFLQKLLDEVLNNLEIKK